MTLKQKKLLSQNCKQSKLLFSFTLLFLLLTKLTRRFDKSSLIRFNSLLNILIYPFVLYPFPWLFPGNPANWTTSGSTTAESKNLKNIYKSRLFTAKINTNSVIYETMRKNLFKRRYIDANTVLLEQFTNLCC